MAEGVEIKTVFAVLYRQVLSLLSKREAAKNGGGGGH